MGLKSLAKASDHDGLILNTGKRAFDERLQREWFERSWIFFRKEAGFDCQSVGWLSKEP